MASRQRTVDVFEKLRIGNIDEEWVKYVWEADFSEWDVLPQDLEEDFRENKCHVSTLKAAQDALLPWTKGEEDIEGEGLWSVLVENDLSYKSLVALLSYKMEFGQKRVANGTQKEAAVAAAGVYFLLLEVPGSGAFKIFHPILFDKAVKTFRMWTQIGLGDPKRKRVSVSPVRSSQGNRRNKSQKRSRDNMPDRDQENPFAGDEEEEEQEEEGVLTPAEIHRIQLGLIQLLRRYVHLLSCYSLRDCDQSAVLSLQTLAELSRMEAETFRGKFDSDVEICNMKTVPQLAYKGLALMCSGSHGHRGPMITGVFQALLPNALMLMGENKDVAAQTIPRSVQQIKDHAVSFVCHLIDVTAEEEVMPVVRTLVQHMCAKVPDKSEYRSKVGQSIVLILSKMSGAKYARMIEWLYKYSRNAKISWRGFALDIVSMLLMEPQRPINNDVPEEYRVFLSHHFLLQMILSRCSDIAPTVRARAISTFAQCLTSRESFISCIIRDMMTPQIAGGRRAMTRVVPTPDPTRTQSELEQSSRDTTLEKEVSVNTMGEGTERVEENGRNISSVSSVLARLVTSSAMTTATTPVVSSDGDRTATSMMTIPLTPGLEITLSDGKGVTSMLRRRALDDKVNVRKSALQALEGIARLTIKDINKEDLDIIEERCRDTALSVRKQALTCLTSLLREEPHNALIQKAWLNGSLPMVLDRESSAQEKCLETIEEVLLSNIVPHHRSKTEHHKMAWELLNLMAGGSQHELRRYLAKCSHQWSKLGKLKANLISALQSHIGTENNDGAWMLLAELSPFSPKFDPSFVAEYWQNTARYAAEAQYGTVERVLTVLTHVTKNISPESCATLAADMKSRLMQFESPPELTVVTVNALDKLCLAQTNDKQALKKLTDQWFGELLQACDRYLSTVILNENQADPVNEDKIVRHLFTLGEIAQLCPTKTPKRVFMLVQSLIAAPTISQENASFENTEAHLDPPLSQQSQMSHTQLPGTQLPFTQCSQEILTQFRGSKMSGKVRAHAFITLGKLCLQNEDLAKKCVAALARELEVSSDLTIRNNVVIIMADLCVRYTTLVDRYVSNISACIKDTAPIVRKQCITLLTRLLQEDYLKWKGSLFYHFVTALVDDITEISDFAEYCMVHLLMQRHPGMFYHHFIECIFFFNSYDGHSVYNKFSQTDREKVMFSLKDNREKRLRIYRFLLEHMTDEHRFQLTAKLCQDVLAAVVDGVLPLDAQTSILVQDTLAILSSKEIKLSTMRSRPQDEIAETEQEMAAVVMNVAKKTLITQVVKKNVMENVVPTVIGLKHMLEQNCSPVLKDLMFFLRELMKDYKAEVKNILAADRQLANEIEFDLRKFEEQQQEETERRRSTASSPWATPKGSPKTRNTPKKITASPGMSHPGTPKDSPVPGVPGTPRVTEPGTPVPGTPQAVINPNIGPQRVAALRATGTPARPLPLSTAAIINSARKAMERAKQLQATASPRDPKAGEKKVGFAPDKVASPKAPSSKDDFKTPVKQANGKAAKSRAISTPSVNTTLGNITFHQGDLSMIPASPSSPSGLRLLQLDGPTTPSWTSRVVEGENGEPVREDIINMFSPDKPPPKPKTWNVRSPSTRKKANSKNTTPSPTPASTTSSRSSRRNQAKEPLASLSNTDNEIVDEQSDENSTSSKGTRKTRSSRRTSMRHKSPRS